MTLRFVIQKLLFLVLVIWAASTITFFIPRISSKNPIQERFAELARDMVVLTRRQQVVGYSRLLLCLGQIQSVCHLLQNAVHGRAARAR